MQVRRKTKTSLRFNGPFQIATKSVNARPYRCVEAMMTQTHLFIILDYFWQNKTRRIINIEFLINCAEEVSGTKRLKFVLL